MNDSCAGGGSGWAVVCADVKSAFAPKLGALAGFFHILLVCSGALSIPYAGFTHVNISPSSETVRYTPAVCEGRSKTHSDTVTCEHCIQCTPCTALSVEICLFPVVLIRITSFLCHFHPSASGAVVAGGQIMDALNRKSPREWLFPEIAEWWQEKR